MYISWADIFLGGMVILFTYGGYHRGLVLEVFDILTIVGGFTIALRGYEGLGFFLKNTILFAYTQEGANIIAFILLLVPSGLAVIACGLHLDRLAKERDRIPKDVRRWGGMATGFLKSILFGCLFVGLFAQTPYITSSDRVAFRKAPVVQRFRTIAPMFQPLVNIMASSKVAQRYGYVLEKNFPRINTYK